MSLISQGTLGRVYGGDPALIHIADGQRAAAGQAMAEAFDSYARRKAFQNGQRNREDALNQPLCPGCYMVVGFNMMVELARSNGQDLRELARSMRLAFDKLDKDAANIEEIEVVLDPD